MNNVIKKNFALLEIVVSASAVHAATNIGPDVWQKTRTGGGVYAASVSGLKPMAQLNVDTTARTATTTTTAPVAAASDAAVAPIVVKKRVSWCEYFSSWCKRK